MVSESIHHENDATCNATRARLALTILQPKIKPISFIVFSCCCKKANRPDYFMVCTLIATTPQNVQNFAVKPIACGLWFHMSFEYLMASFLWSIRVQTMKKSGRFVKFTSDTMGLVGWVTLRAAIRGAFSLCRCPISLKNDNGKRTSFADS